MLSGHGFSLETRVSRRSQRSSSSWRARELALMIPAPLFRRRIKRCDLREHGARDGDAFTLARIGGRLVHDAAFTDGADVRQGPVVSMRRGVIHPVGAPAPDSRR